MLMDPSHFSLPRCQLDLTLSLYEYHKVLCRPDLVTSRPGAEIVTHMISNEMLAGVWARLRDRLSAVDSSFGMVHVTENYAAHFYISMSTSTKVSI